MKRRNHTKSLSALTGLVGVSVGTAGHSYRENDPSAACSGGARVVWDGTMPWSIGDGTTDHRRSATLRGALDG